MQLQSPSRSVGGLGPAVQLAPMTDKYSRARQTYSSPRGPPGMSQTAVFAAFRCDQLPLPPPHTFHTLRLWPCRPFRPLTTSRAFTTPARRPHTPRSCLSLYHMPLPHCPSLSCLPSDIAEDVLCTTHPSPPPQAAQPSQPCPTAPAPPPHPPNPPAVPPVASPRRRQSLSPLPTPAAPPVSALPH